MCDQESLLAVLEKPRRSCLRISAQPSFQNTIDMRHSCVRIIVG